MNKILIIGAGRSTSSLISYLLKQSTKFDWEITVADSDLNLAQTKIKGFPNAKAISFDVNNVTERETAIKAAKKLGLAIAGVDMLQSSRGPLVMEVNSSPGLEGIEGATGVDIAGKIIDAKSAGANLCGGAARAWVERFPSCGWSAGGSVFHRRCRT